MMQPKLHIRHGGEQASADFSADAHRHDFQYAAFFADCEHEVVPVQSGYRFCAVFNSAPRTTALTNMSWNGGARTR